MTDLLTILANPEFWVAVLRIATPLILGTLGVLLCERAGVLNLGIEGIMVAGAFSGWLAVYSGLPLWGGVLVAALTGAVFGLLSVGLCAAIWPVLQGVAMPASAAAAGPVVDGSTPGHGVWARTGLTLAYVGDGANNMAHSYLLGCALAGMHVRIGAPADYLPDERIVLDAKKLAAEHGGSIQVTTDHDDASADFGGPVDGQEDIFIIIPGTQ